MSLEHDLKAFRRELPKLLKDPACVGQFALVHEGKVHGVWGTFDDALEAGYERFGIDPFIVKQVVEHEPVYYFSRRITSCR
jgi:hypothetical protein